MTQGSFTTACEETKGRGDVHGELLRGSSAVKRREKKKGSRPVKVGRWSGKGEARGKGTINQRLCGFRKEVRVL